MGRNLDFNLAKVEWYGMEVDYGYLRIRVIPKYIKIWRNTYGETTWEKMLRDFVAKCVTLHENHANVMKHHVRLFVAVSFHFQSKS